MTTDTQKPDTATCRLVQAGPQFEGKQWLTYAVGISAESVGSKHVHLLLATIAPGARVKAHTANDWSTMRRFERVILLHPRGGTGCSIQRERG